MTSRRWVTIVIFTQYAFSCHCASLTYAFHVFLPAPPYLLQTRYEKEVERNLNLPLPYKQSTPFNAKVTF
jgi:hypothetical protein